MMDRKKKTSGGVTANVLMQNYFSFLLPHSTRTKHTFSGKEKRFPTGFDRLLFSIFSQLIQFILTVASKTVTG